MAHSGRRKTFVDAKVQGALVRRLVLHWCLFIGVAGAVAFCLQVLSNPFRPMEEHLQQVWWTHGPFLLVMFFMLPVFIVDTIRLSHRFAGPVFRLRNVIRSLAQGARFQPIKFRDVDFWQGLADDFNRMVERLSRTSGENEPASAAAEPAERDEPLATAK